MGKKKKSESLGRALIKDRFSSRGKRNDSMLHTAELNDGYDWGRLNLQSVTEESSFDEFLRTAELAGTEFQAEKLNVNFVNIQTAPGLLTQTQRDDFERTKQEKEDVVRIPRRPKWDRSMTGDELESLEKESFLEWRRGLARLQEEESLVLTPYEKNLDFWRQLWRVVERSDVVVQIVDARNPLLYRSQDLERYVLEISQHKTNFLLLNKADLLTPRQRRCWARYFDSLQVKCCFYSAIEHLETLHESASENLNDNNGSDSKSDEKADDLEDDDEADSSVSETSEETHTHRSDTAQDTDAEAEEGMNSSKLLSREELMMLFEELCGSSTSGSSTSDSGGPGRSGRSTVGLVGYPNVGKSSTINSLLTVKKVSVSATPGKTKHFQTLLVDGWPIELCDCPGLVFPSLVATKADMLLSGILPIDHMTDYSQAVATLRSLIPDHVLQSIYGIMIPQQPPGAAEHSPHTLLSSYAYSRGFMTANGCPDMSRGARLILKDFVNGKLLYCYPPPGQESSHYHPFPQSLKKPPQLTAIASRAIADRKTVSVKDLDSSFFAKATIGAHSKGSSMAGVVLNKNADVKTSGSQGQSSKPWKDHSHKRNKKEKLRRLYRHLDE